MKEVRIDVIDPVHFHGALPFQQRYDIEGLDVSPIVHVYHATANPLGAFKGMIAKKDAEKIGWKFEYHSSDNPLEDLVTNGKGNMLVVACPNVDKAKVIESAVNAGHQLVLADKPWVIEPTGLDNLMQAIITANEKRTLLVDIMTERYEFGTILQMSIMQDRALFGELQPGTPANHGIYKASVHILDKSHMGVVRPPQYFDTGWQGEGIVDVTTHLVDMVFMFLRPDSCIEIRDIDMTSAGRWSTEVPQADFEKITKTTEKSPLNVYCNGLFGFVLDEIHVGIQDTWDLKGTDDSHYSRIEGSNITVEVIKGPDEKYQQVYITPKVDKAQVKGALDNHVASLASKGYEGITIEEQSDGRFKLVVPANYYTNHFQHFGEVTMQALKYLAGQDPYPREVEMARLLIKYQTTMKALEMARR